MSQESVRDALTRTIANINTNPKLSNVVFKAETEWEKDTLCNVRIREFPGFKIDEPPELGGQDTAPNPVEMVLAALGTCQEIMYSAYASLMGIQLDSIHVTARGYLDLKGQLGLDQSVPPGYKRIVFETDIDSPASDEALSCLVDTVESHCPVLDILKRAQQVSGSVTVHGSRLASNDSSAA
jgi:putative redox protein